MHYAIIAAGQGSRLRNEGIDTPKPLVRLGGVTLLERLIGIFRSRPDCEAVSVIINPEVQAFAEASDSPLPWAGADNLVVASTPGSMHSLHRLSPLLRATGPRFCLTTVDTVFHPAEFDAYLDAMHADTQADGYMAVTTYIDDEKPLYITISTPAESMITGFFDTPLPGARHVSGGIYALPVSSLDILDDCMAAGETRMRDFQRALVAAGMRLRAYNFSRIIDIDHASDIPKALSLLSI